MSCADLNRAIDTSDNPNFSIVPVAIQATKKVEIIHVQEIIKIKYLFIGKLFRNYLKRLKLELFHLQRMCIYHNQKNNLALFFL